MELQVTNNLIICMAAKAYMIQETLTMVKNGITHLQIPNDELSWEKSKNFNVGIDFWNIWMFEW